MRFRERRVAPAGPEGLRATLEAGGDGSMVRIRSQDAATLRAVLERHGATVTPGLDEGVLFVTDMGAAQVAELAAIRGIILSE